MLDFTNIGMALRLLRRQRGLKQSKVAEAARITSPMLSAYETGKQKPSFNSIDKILGAMGYDPLDLAGALEKAGDGEQSSGDEHRAHRLALPSLSREPLDAEEQVLMNRLLPAVLDLLRYLKG